MQKSFKKNKIRLVCVGVVASCFLVALTSMTNYRFEIFKNVQNNSDNLLNDLKQTENMSHNAKANPIRESLSLVKPLDHNTNKSRNFKEIYFAKSKNNQKYFSLIYENNNLYFKTIGSSTLLEAANLSERAADDNSINTLNGVTFEKNILAIDKISLSANGNTTSQTTAINTNFNTSKEAPTFIKKSNNSYFQAGTNNNINLNFTNSDTFLVRFYLNGGGGDSLSMFYDDGNGNVIDQNSTSTDQASINMLSKGNSIAIEGWITKTADGIKFSFAKPTGPGNNNSLIGTVDASIFEPLKSKRADQALSEIENGDPSTPAGMTWAKYFKQLDLNGFNDAQTIFSSFQATANSAKGEIVVEIYNPLITQTGTPTTNLQHYVYMFTNRQPIQIGTISGFNTGTILLKNNFETTIQAIPEFAIDNNDHLLNVYKLLFEEGFGPNNLLDIFNYQTDMKLDNFTFDNLNGTLEANLTILNNYRDPLGNPITDSTPKDFGKIFINSFLKISATEIITDNLNLPIDSPLISQIPSEAIKNEASLIDVIYQNRNTLLSNLPNDTNTARNVVIDDFTIDIIMANNARGTISLKVHLGYYFNKDFGIYNNTTPLEFTLNIAGFAQTKETVIDTSKVYSLENTMNIYPQIYINDSNINNVIQNYIFDNTDSKLYIIENAPLKGTPNGFNTNDILIKNILPFNLRGEIEVTFTILKWYDQFGALMTKPFPEDAKIIFSNFKKAEVTYINIHNANNLFLFENRNLSPTEFLAMSDNQTRIKQFILDNAFNVSSQSIISGTLPSDNFNLSNINLISSKPLDLQGQIEIEFSINSYIEDDGNIIINGSSNLTSPLIKIAGFYVVEETRLLSNFFLAPENEHNNPAVSFNIEKTKRFLIEELQNNRLLNSYPINIFNPEVDLDIREYQYNNILGEVYVNLFVKNYYDASGIVQSTFKLMGPITINGFSQLKVTSIENNKTFSITDTSYQEKYVDQITELDVKNMIKIFASKNQLIINVPSNFDYDNNINNIVIQPDKIQSIISVEFSINYYYNDQGIPVNNPLLQGSVIFSGFLTPPITKLNNNIYDFNTETVFEIQAIYSEPLSAVQILEYINIYGFENIMLNGKIIGNPIITIDNPKNTSQKLEIIYNENSLKINPDGTLSFSCTFTGGYYYYDSIPIEIQDTTQIRTFTIYNLGVLTDSSITAPTIIGLIVAGSIVGLIAMFILAYLIRKRMIVKSSYGDRYDDEDPSNKISF